MSDLKSVKNMVVIVTGAAQGIGKAIAWRFGTEGARVVVSDILADLAKSVANEITAAGGQAVGIGTDVSSETAVHHLFATVMETYGTVDVLINNAGVVSPTKHFLEADKAWWDSIVDVNLTGTFLCSLAAAKIMAERGQGVIINMSSGGATRAHRGFVPYDATKGGIEAMTRAMALDLGPYGIRVNTMVPGSIDTKGLTPEERQFRGRNIPLGRIGEPDDLTGTAVFLASDDARYITGHSFVIDGGMLAQQRSATVDIFPLSRFPNLEKASESKDD